MSFLGQYIPLLDTVLLAVGFAFSQQVVLRAGVFSVATAGFAAIGSYCAAILVTRLEWHPLFAMAAACLFGALTGFLLAQPLARLRGIYQAIATLAFVQIVIAVTLFAEPITGGGLGINNIPKSVGTGTLAVAVLVTAYILHSVKQSGVGRAFDAIHQDETVAAVLGISIRKYQTLAFLISGCIAGAFGGLQALNTYSIAPTTFSFAFVIMVLGYIVVGGRRSVLGPVVGVAVLTLLPELSRFMAEWRPILTGATMILISTYLPLGLADTLIARLRMRRLSHAQPEGGHSVRTPS
ncbi:branched-chain amino acid ABC transporter permease [Chelatococcus asaccharovorans]|uniref:Amino acid/amide ABC transporter membrane protein 2 (HAAT family) n=1 Tax=Chelatococcus asaccharovorans TaxID=28210 RepID=A0A2V3U8T0_9HYPH|nr:branched-chain amino acid ABC transporter permease [Chelatococcus asaccharovorans]MBS7705496.1 branched-chain amino acid ABC transporter permease [Chelatococcus asaccharovorans]PXW60099.1 amino acid/amide ABC transporter membrane protein 2 (HAAT family) [Chelatococcus asaccharovorans]CAH1655934.1 Amino acid/amide ABC transporter membrane protein 2 (HAAT family) [Chelatococcus asaccharovorans]CAH1685259.1 Amino acid/amide ABC transporter membrane protein 2 (HAAT family) [Chelatococcus asaccha